MFDRKTIEKLGGWEGYRVARIEWPQSESRAVTIHLKPSASTMYCAHCSSRCRQVHETSIRRVRDLHGILSRCRHPLNTSIVEGINNTIKAIKRRTYGYRDQEYVSLKIHTAFPGIQR